MRERRYVAQCERDEAGWWIVTLEKLPGVVTQAKSLSQARDRARAAVGLWLDISTESVALELDVVGAQDARSEWLEGREALQRSAALREAGSAKTRDAVRKLLRKGLSVRDTAVVLDVSAAKVQQLAAAPKAVPKPTAKHPATRVPAKKKASVKKKAPVNKRSAVV
jgi:predicted RNase H-like HicB family nuclease